CSLRRPGRWLVLLHGVRAQAGVVNKNQQLMHLTEGRTGNLHVYRISAISLAVHSCCLSDLEHVIRSGDIDDANVIAGKSGNSPGRSIIDAQHQCVLVRCEAMRISEAKRVNEAYVAGTSERSKLHSVIAVVHESGGDREGSRRMIHIREVQGPQVRAVEDDAHQVTLVRYALQRNFELPPRAGYNCRRIKIADRQFRCYWRV